MTNTLSWTGDADFIQANLGDDDLALCHLTIERFPGSVDAWEWRVWPAMDLRQGHGLDRRGTSSSRASALRAVRRAAIGLRPGLSRLREVLGQPAVAAFEPRFRHPAQAAVSFSPSATIHVLRTDANRSSGRTAGASQTDGATRAA